MAERLAGKISVTKGCLHTAFGLFLVAGLSGSARAQQGTAPAHAPYTFRSVAIVGGGFITGILPHPTVNGLTYLRTDIGGAYRRDPGADHWTPLTDWVGGENSNLMGIEAMACDATDPDRVYLAAGTYDREGSPNGAVLISKDRGRTFETVELPLKMGGNEDGRSAGERLAVDPWDPASVYFGSRKNGLWKSADHAHTWTRLNGLPAPADGDFGVTFLAFDRDSKGVLYAGVATAAASLYRSLDAGQTWAEVEKAPTGLLPNHGVIAGGFLYVTYGDRPGPNGMTLGAVWRLELKSGRWKDISPEAPTAAVSFGYGGLSVDAAHPETLVVSTMDRWHPGDDIFRSTDAGKHWKSLKEKAVRDDSISPYLAGEDGNIGFGHWMGALALAPGDPNRMLYGTGATLWASADLLEADQGRATHWTVGAKGIEETAVISLLSPPAGPHLFSGLGDIGCFRNDDLHVSPRGGALSQPRLSNCDSLSLAAQKPNLMVRAGRVWSGSSHGGFSRDEGQTWMAFPKEPATAESGGTVALSADGSVVEWLTGKGVLAVSKDMGASWKVEAEGLIRGEMVVDPVASARFYIYDPASGQLTVRDEATADAKEVSSQVPTGGKLAIAPDGMGALWLGSKSGLFRIHAGAEAVTSERVAGVDAAYAVGFGKPRKDQGPATIFLSGKVDGVQGVFRSTDAGRQWLQVDDERHRYGWIRVMTGDPRVFGRVYLGTNGRGVVVADVVQ